MKHRTVAGAGIAVLALIAVGQVSCHASITLYSGYDDGAVPGGTFTNSNAAASSFYSAAGFSSSNTVDFESYSTGTYSTLNIPNASVTGSSGVTVSNADDVPGSALFGFNTTPGGSNYLDLDANGGQSETFTFATPISSFGAYFTGIQPGFFQDTLNFNDGTSETLDVPGNAKDGGVSFLGFTDPGTSISSITVVSGNGSSWDDIGIDDVAYSDSAVPEPSTWTVVGFGVATLGVLILRRRTSISGRMS